MTGDCKHEHGWDIEMRCPACGEYRYWPGQPDVIVEIANLKAQILELEQRLPSGESPEEDFTEHMRKRRLAWDELARLVPSLYDGPIRTFSIIARHFSTDTPTLPALRAIANGDLPIRNIGPKGRAQLVDALKARP